MTIGGLGGNSQEEILTRATDLLRKARGDCLRLGQMARVRTKAHKETSSVASTIDGADSNQPMENLRLSSFGSK